ncbi:hypothetical protein WN48_06324 [Eufriesea mexicana]|nr:hypothetical protein WN48_06324 [Eufriesea mexicana]
MNTLDAMTLLGYAEKQDSIVSVISQSAGIMCLSEKPLCVHLTMTVQRIRAKYL